MNNKYVKNSIKLVSSFALGFVLAVILNAFFTKSGINYVSNILFGDKSNVSDLKELIKKCINLKEADILTKERIKILTIAFSYICSHLVFGIRKTFRILFKYRWIVGGVVLCLLVASRYNGDSMDPFEAVEYGEGTEYEFPIIGFETPNRSDETIVSTPRKLWYYSNGLPGTTFNVSSIIKNPTIIVSKLLMETVGVDYAYSLDWYFYIILAVLISLEFFMIITEKKQLLSLAATMMIFCSTFYLWWIFPAQLINSMGIVTSFYYCIKTKNNIYRFLLGISTAIFSIRFVFNLYPAWQVPTAYIILALMIWIVIDRFDDLKSFKKKQWAIVCSCVLLMFVGMYVCYLDELSYISSVSATVYPGERIEYGKYTLSKLYNYIPAALFWLKKPDVMSENGIIINLFPIPIIASVIYIIKNKKKDFLLIGVSLATLLLVLYCSNEGLSQSIAKITLLSHATSWRAVDIIAYAQVILFARVVGVYRVDNSVEQNNKLWQNIRALLCGGVFAVYSIHISKVKFGEYMTQIYIFVWAFLLTLIAYLVISRMSYKKYICLSSVLILISLFTGFIIRPIRKGTDAIYSKPIASVMREIKDKDDDAVWITCQSLTTQAFVKAFGFDVINYVNVTPNMKLWKQLDPEGDYNEVYNRYAHVVVDFTENDTSFELIQTDAFYLHLSYKDMKKTGTDYIFSHQALDYDNDYFGLESVYEGSGAYIYKVKYYK